MFNFEQRGPGDVIRFEHPPILPPAAFIPTGHALMHNYRFTLRHSAAGNEDLGDIPLTDDNEAFAFARRIIRELMERYAAEYADAAMGIKQGKRIVGSIPFDFEVAMKPLKYG